MFEPSYAADLAKSMEEDKHNEITMSVGDAELCAKALIFYSKRKKIGRTLAALTIFPLVVSIGVFDFNGDGRSTFDDIVNLRSPLPPWSAGLEAQAAAADREAEN